MPVSDQTKPAVRAALAALFGSPRRRPLAPCGLLLAGLMVTTTAAGQVEVPADGGDPGPSATSGIEASPDPAAQASQDTGMAEEQAREGEPVLSPEYGLTEEQVTAYQPQRNPADDYLDAIDRVESDYGPYATELSDLYLGLGQALIEAGDFEEARDAIHRGVMVQRVNAGPNSPEQTNQLFQLANVELLLGEWREADEVVRNIYFINTNYYGDTSAELLPVIDRIYTWYMLTRPPGSPNMDYINYETVIEITEEAARVSEKVNGKGHPETARAYQRQGDAEFQMVRHLTGAAMMVSPELYVASTTGNMTSPGFGADIVVKHYNAGRRAYLHFLESLAANESTTPIQYAEALADLGDWFMIFDKPRKSRSLYEQGYAILLQNDAPPEVVESYMGRPQPMHFIFHQLPDFLVESPDAPRELQLEIQMTVNSYGEVREVEVLNAPEGLAEEAIKQIEKQVRLTPFRPAMKQGRLVTTREFIWKYEIIPDWAAS